jgi:alpha-ketoglutarate-dependent taurine dioxygenase
MKPEIIRRKPIRLTGADLVSMETLQPEQLLPLVIRPTIDGVNLLGWVKAHRQTIETLLMQHGGILFRQFQWNGVTEFEQVIQAVSDDVLEYQYRSTPRTTVSGNIYTSTEYPPEQSIPLHNELSYTSTYPLKIWFACFQAASQGGETPIADSRMVLKQIPAPIQKTFQHQQVMYVRNYSDNLDLSWQTVFQTTDKAVVEHYCQKSGIEFEWFSERHLQTRQVCPAIAVHPRTGEAVWFNQAHLFHISNLPPELQNSLLTTVGETNLPRNAYYGDGSPIAATVLDEIRAVYQRTTIVFPWQVGDVLLLDNLLTAHGRHPFTGSRKVLVGMAERIQRCSK